MRILVVDDHQLLCVALCAHLERLVAKYTTEPVAVTSAFTLEDALASIGSDDRPDLVFLDLNLGHNANGADTLKQFQDGNPRGVPVAVFTGLDPKDDQSLETFRRCIQLNTAGILLKGSNLDEIFLGIDRLIHKEFFVPSEVLKSLATRDPKEPSVQNSHLGLSPRE